MSTKASQQTETSALVPQRVTLPPAPDHLRDPVKAWQQDVEILAFRPEKPDLNPMFLEKRVYQGSSGKVYPLPFIDRIAIEPAMRQWKAVHIENEYLRLMILPEIGGRIHIGYDKTTGYDFFYRQNVIKPALVGLAGPWISGGVEFNWPQHHRPATFMPVDTEIETGPDGSVTIWCSDHDPMLRMKGMHGICLHPGCSILELKVRLFNRTPLAQTFLWWANVATHVHEKYQSFFPNDVRYVADHAKRAVSSFPLSHGHYYGVDYEDRARNGVPADELPRMFVPDGSYPANDLSWYANIPVPTSYMITATEEDFFGGYDHKAEAGVVHVANHHVAPGKKQWTWGNHEFGYAWDRSLTDNDGPYIELMAGVFTDNQPDFSYLAPWETRTFSQHWYPIHAIGIPQAANLDAALSIGVRNGQAQVGVQATRSFASVTVKLAANGIEIANWERPLGANEPILLTADLPAHSPADALSATVAAGGKPVIEFIPSKTQPAPEPSVAQEPAAPEEVASVEELYLVGLHLEQYRHATRSPEPYWQEGLRRDPGNSQLHNALGLWRLRRGELQRAADHFQAAIATLTRFNPNPRDGEPFYNLGLACRYLGMQKEAYDAFYKATWNAAWQSPAYLALAECDCSNRNWATALDHLKRCLHLNPDNLTARNVMAIVLEETGQSNKASQVAHDSLRIDPLDIAARWRLGIAPSDGQQCLDLAFDLLRAGQSERALKVLGAANLQAGDGSAPMVLFTAAFAQEMLGRGTEAAQLRRRASDTPMDYCFPHRIEEMLVLESAIAADQDNWAAHYLLGNLLYDKRRHHEAINHWKQASQSKQNFPVLYRNLGIASFNVQNNPDEAIANFDRALKANPHDARVLYERDQLWKRIGKTPQERLQELEQYPHLVHQRDDLTVELATLFNQTGKPQDALKLLTHRKFQPWEGGEGLVLGQYVRSRMLLGRQHIENNAFPGALEEFQAALQPPPDLGEAKHLLANQSDIYYWLGVVFHQMEKQDTARAWWQRAAQQKGDFQQMSVRHISDMTCWSGLALRQLGEEEAATALFRQIHNYSIELENTEPKIDYFATSLPAMLLFEEDLKRRSRIDALFLRAQAAFGLGNNADATGHLQQVLQMDSNHAAAEDLLLQIEHKHNPGRVL